MRISSAEFLAALEAADKVLYYEWCVDLSLVGNGYKVTEIVSFVKTTDTPLTDFIQVKKYSDSFLLVLIYTKDAALIGECVEYLTEIAADFAEIEMRTPFPSVLCSPMLTDRFSIGASDYPSNHVYCIRHPDALILPPANRAVTVTHFTDADRLEIKRAADSGSIDRAEMNADMFIPPANCKDVRWYILRVDGEIGGYLRAECCLGDIYNIGWLYMEPNLRGHGYAAYLVAFFAKEMFTSGKIPHYGYAVSEQSARVAKKCGFRCEQPAVACRSLRMK